MIIEQGVSQTHISYINTPRDEFLEFHLKENSFLKLLVLSAHGTTINQKIEIHLVGKGATVEIYGYAYAPGGSIINHHTSVTHHCGDTHSSQKFIHLVRQKGQSHFLGHIKVDQHANDVTSHQLSKNILLEDLALATTKPQLEIYADQVKCNHGASVGSLSQEEIYYLQSRGISPSNARKLIQQGSLNEILAPFPQELLEAHSILSKDLLWLER